MTILFNPIDYRAAREAALMLPKDASNENVALIITQSKVPLLIYFFTHVCEQRRHIRVSSLFYLDSLRRETERRCIVFGDGKDEVVKEIMELATSRAQLLWKSSRETTNYAPSEYIKDSLIEFLQRQS